MQIVNPGALSERLWSINASHPSAAYMRQWFSVSIGSDNGLSPIRRQAII